MTKTFNHFVLYTQSENGHDVAKQSQVFRSMRSALREGKRLAADGAKQVKFLWTEAGA